MKHRQNVKKPTKAVWRRCSWRRSSPRRPRVAEKQNQVLFKVLRATPPSPRSRLPWN